jgi:type IV secretory pathway VirB2 component (pilin)
MNEMNQSEASSQNCVALRSHEEWQRQRQIRRLMRATLIVLLTQGIMSAAATGLPWEAAAGMIINSLLGPVGILIAIAAALFAFWELGHRPDVMQVNKSMVIIPFSITGVLGAAQIVKLFFPAIAGAVV